VISAVVPVVSLGMPGTKGTIPANNAQNSLALAVIIATYLNAIIVILDMYLLRIVHANSEIAQPFIPIARLAVKMDAQPAMMDMPSIPEPRLAQDVLNSIIQIVISAPQLAVLAARLVSRFNQLLIVLVDKPAAQIIVTLAVKKTVKLAVLAISTKITPANREDVPSQTALNVEAKAVIHALKDIF